MAACGEKAVKEGSNLLGPPSFQILENGRFRCVETGHEMVVGDIESYSQSQRCRLGLIDFALSNNKLPLNMFKQSPLSRSKLICKLTGDTLNKSEEHIWKHIDGKRFLNKLEEKETGNLSSNGILEHNDVEESEKELKTPVSGGNKKRKNKQKDKRAIEEIIYEMRDPPNQDDDSEEADFWMPPQGEHCDFDDGADRWGSSSEAEDDSDEVHGKVCPSLLEASPVPKKTKKCGHLKKEGFEFSFPDWASAFGDVDEFTLLSSDMIFPKDKQRFAEVTPESVGNFATQNLYQAFEAVLSVRESYRGLKENNNKLRGDHIELQKELKISKRAEQHAQGEADLLTVEHAAMKDQKEILEKKNEELRAAKVLANQKIALLEERVQEVADDAIICTSGRLMKEFKEGKFDQWEVDRRIDEWDEYLKMLAEDEAEKGGQSVVYLPDS